MKMVHLPTPDEIYDAYPHQLSGGQRQRILICMALILKPSLLIADEPTTALDVTTQKQILSLIKELQRTLNTAVIFITHDFGVVAEIADRIVVMNKGAIVETGTREQILSRPKQAYTRMLISSVPSLVPKDETRQLGAPILSVTGLSRVYREFKLFRAGRSVNAVKDAKFTLRKGEIVGIVGESGSGKSTLARCISRLIEPTTGTINLGGHDIANLSSRQLRPFRRRIQIVFQDPYRSLNARIRVGDSIVEGLLNFGTRRPEARQKATELIRLVGMEPDVLERYPHQFSGGQRQRICIARALSLEPDVLVADEAVSALDVSVQSQILALVQSIRDKRGIGIVFITHDLRVAAQICDTIIVMQNGAIVEAAAARQVLLDPSHEYTRALLSAAPGRGWDFKNFRPT
jgi:peptide/nickel transport system ATP-binding protein